MEVPVSNRILKDEHLVVALIPAFNEAAYIEQVVTEAKKYVELVIVVDDGSTDGTSEVAALPGVKILRNSRRKGKGFALRRGLIECLRLNADIVVTLDGDGQHNPTDIPKLVEPLISRQADVVIGSRYIEQFNCDAPRHRQVGLAVINRMNKVLMKTAIKDSQSGYRSYSKEVLATILKYDSSGYGAELEQIAALENSGFKIAEVSVTMRYKGLARTSKEHPLSHGIHIFYTIIRVVVERKPLLFFGTSGLVLLLLSLLPATELVTIFNDTRYFSLPLALIMAIMIILGSLFLLVSTVFFALKRIREREEIISSNVQDLLNRMKDSERET